MRTAPVALLSLALLGGCAAVPGCFVGVSVFPPTPFILCGIDTAPAGPADD